MMKSQFLSNLDSIPCWCHNNGSVRVKDHVTADAPLEHPTEPAMTSTPDKDPVDVKFFRSFTDDGAAVSMNDLGFRIKPKILEAPGNRFEQVSCVGFVTFL